MLIVLEKSYQMTQHSPLAVLADIHGNALALEAVLADARQRGVNEFVNLGDTFYGPLDPVGTWRILKETPMPSILGNQDRILLEGGEQWESNPAFVAALDALGNDGVAWLSNLPATLLMDGILLCHGTPKDDMTYLLEDISTGLPAMRNQQELRQDLFPEADGCSLVLCGHSHHPGQAHCDDITVVNPGSVGLPAYDDDAPPHIMASGSPHAKYAIVTSIENKWKTDFISVEYDWNTAADLARANGREDWAEWLLTGSVL